MRYYAGEFKLESGEEFVDLAVFLDRQRARALARDGELQELEDAQDHDHSGLARNVKKLQDLEMEETIYKWRLYRKVSPAVYLCHLHRIEEAESKQTFTSMYDCLLDFNLNCVFDFVHFYPDYEFILCVEAMDCPNPQ